MNLQSYNKALAQQCKKGLYFAFYKNLDPDDEEVYYCCDTDRVKYVTISKKGLLILQFTCIDVELIWNYGHRHMCETYYKNIKCQLKSDHDHKYVELIIDQSILQHLMNSLKHLRQEQILGVKKFDKQFDFISKKLACIKRHFFASPFEIMLNAAMKNAQHKQKNVVPNLSYNIKQQNKERVWISFAPNNNQFTVYFGISFDDRSQQQLGRILLSQLTDAMRHVTNSHGVSVSESELPAFLIEAFPNEKNSKYQFSNGIISFTIFGSLIKNPKSIASFLAGFRTYVYYHIQASKCYLHSRVLRRIDKGYKELCLTKIQPFAQK